MDKTYFITLNPISLNTNYFIHSLNSDKESLTIKSQVLFDRFEKSKKLIPKRLREFSNS